ncbi:MAG: hypothetical protein GY797_36050 [Deltaproteobacteria bacterium]|nr:hypothetical protein [Deltaproteobacteria bacterium]
MYGNNPGRLDNDARIIISLDPHNPICTNKDGEPKANAKIGTTGYNQDIVIKSKEEIEALKIEEEEEIIIKLRKIRVQKPNPGNICWIIVPTSDGWYQLIPIPC